MGFADTASTMGMAVAGLAVGSFSQHIDRRHGILLSRAILAIPTTLLAAALDLTVFTAAHHAGARHGVDVRADAPYLMGSLRCKGPRL